MSDVTGPIATLPGSRHPVPSGMKCDDHPERDAVARIQGETDSFGSEMHDLCAECVADLKQAAADDRGGRCDWCKRDALDLRPLRDLDEGMYGPVYYVCGDCSRSYHEELAAQAAEYDDQFDHDWDEDYPDPIDEAVEWWRDETLDPNGRAWVSK